MVFELVYDLCQFLFTSLVGFLQLNSRPQTYPRMKLLLAYPVERCDVLLYSHQIETALGYLPESLIILRQLVTVMVRLSMQLPTKMNRPTPSTIGAEKKIECSGFPCA